MNYITSLLQHIHSGLLARGAYVSDAARAPRLLATLSGDALAQVLSFIPSPPSLAVAAAAPRARLFTELRRVWDYRVQLFVDTSSDVVRHALNSEYAYGNFRNVFGLATWWLEKCGLPLKVYGAVAASTVLGAGARVCRRLDAVQLEDSPHAVPNFDAAAVAQLQELCAHERYGMLRHAPPSLLTRLRVVALHDCSDAVFELCRALPALTQLTLIGLRRPRVCLRDFVAVAQLHHVYVGNSEVQAITGFERCISLVEVKLRGCLQLQSLAPLAEAPRLRCIHASWSGVRVLDGLGGCETLEYIDLTECRRLESLAALAGAPRLHTINATSSGVRWLGGLSRCPRLTNLTLASARQVEDLAPLAHAPHLRSIDARRSGVRGIDGLNTCPALEYVDLSECAGLRSVASLAGAPRLQRVLISSNVSDCDVVALANVEVVVCVRG